MIWLAIGLPILLLLVYEQPQPDAPLDRAAIDSIPPGTIARLSDLSKIDAETVCALRPYQDRIYTRAAFTDRTNAYIAERPADLYHSVGLYHLDGRIPVDEGYFTFVFIRHDAIRHMTFRRSPRLDIASGGPTAESWPKGFSARECVSGEHAVLAKILFDGRAYIDLREAD